MRFMVIVQKIRHIPARVAKVEVSPIVMNNATNIEYDLSEVVLPSGVTQVSVASSAMSETGSDSVMYPVVKNCINSDTSLDSLSGLTVYNLKLLDQNGSAITSFTGAIKVKIPTPAGLSGNLHVYWYDGSTGSLTDMNATQEDGYLVFETTHFSYYVIAQLLPSANNPDTGSSTFPVIPLVLLVTGVAAGYVMVKCRVRLKIKKNGHQS